MGEQLGKTKLVGLGPTNSSISRPRISSLYKTEVTTFTTLLHTIVQLKSFNTSYLTDSYIGFTLKLESVSKNTNFGLKMMVKSGLEKIFLKFLHVGDYFP